MSIEAKIGLPSPEIGRLLKNVEPLSFDLDGVIVNLVDITLNVYNFRHGTSLTILDITDSYRLDEIYKEMSGCTQEQANAYMTAMWNSKECLEGATPVVGALELLDHLDELNIGYHFITSRPFSVFQNTQKWFERNRSKNRFLKALMQTSETYNRKHKMETIRAYGVKIHFEDMREHAMDIIENTEAVVVLVNYPANESLPDHPRIIRPQNRNDYGNILASYEALISHLSGNF